MKDERTPSGGDRADTIFLDAGGNPLPSAEGAVEVEIREYVDDIMINRTYGAIDPARTASPLPAWTPPGEAVGEPDAWDTTKNVWDVYGYQDGQLVLVTTVEALFAAVGVKGDKQDKRAWLSNLMRLPVWRAAPEELKREVVQWMADS